MEIPEKLREIVGKGKIILVNRGNTAIEKALQVVKSLTEGTKRKKILIPDQGGWLTYPKAPKKFAFEVVKIKTDEGVFDSNSLKQIEEESRSAAAILYENPAGYYANQNLDLVYDLCSKNSCLVILDISGCIGWDELYDSRYCDIVVGSFGRWKPINLEHGGFIATDLDIDSFLKVSSEDMFDVSQALLLKKKLEGLQNRYTMFEEKVSKIKEDLSRMNVLHADRRGINVIVAFSSLDEKEEIINYCESNDFEYTLCPRYIRVNRDAVSIEVKRK